MAVVADAQQLHVDAARRRDGLLIIGALLLGVLGQAVAGDIGAATAELEKAGQAGENAAKDYIQSGNLAPNSGFTLSGGWMRNRISGKPFHAGPKGSSTPLIDTGSLRSSITHVMEKG